MKKIVKIVLITIYSLLIIITTGYLLTFNEYNTSVIGNKTIITSPIDGFNKNSLVIVSKSEADKLDEVIYYDSYKGYRISKNKIKTVYKDSKNTYLLENGQYLESNLLIGTTTNAKEIPIIGKIIQTVSSEVGYLVFVILPILIAFGYEIHILKKEQKVIHEK